MHSVPRTAASRMPLPRSLFKRIARDASVPASGATVAEFARLLPRSSTSSVPLRFVASEYGTSPRNALRSVFLALRRAAAAKKRKRIAVRLAQAAEKLGHRVTPRWVGRSAETGNSPGVTVSRRLQ